MESNFSIYHEDYMGSEPKIIRAFNAYSAALEYAEYYNTQADYCLMNDSVEIEVADNSGNKTKFKISAEPSVDYSASEI